MFAGKVRKEDGQCNQFVLYDTLDDKDDLALKPGIDVEMIDVYLKAAEGGKLCYSPDDVSVANLKDGCATLDIVCTGEKNVMYCERESRIVSIVNREFVQFNDSKKDCPHPFSQYLRPPSFHVQRYYET